MDDSFQLRELCVRTFKGGMRGHLPSALSLVDILNVLYSSFHMVILGPFWEELSNIIVLHLVLMECG
jgi:transketolase N-terminal domain/subunit